MNREARTIGLRGALLLVLLGGCNFSIPNGLFACGQPSDCPTGFFCWSTDNRCYDTKEPECEPDSCEEVLAEFVSLGFEIECGSLPDGCDGTIACGDCPDGTECGAEGDKFMCGCDEYTCASYGGGAQCGLIPARCDGAGGTIDCGDTTSSSANMDGCFGETQCVDNRCVCPDGNSNCEISCPGGEPTYPCSENECSPVEGLADGCGGVAHCPPCANGQECVLNDDNGLYECPPGECTCAGQGVECGTATICDRPTLCGTCEENGFGSGYRCESGKCLCEDEHEPNESPNSPALVCGDGAAASCSQDAWGVEVKATLEGINDVDFYELRVGHAGTSVIAEAQGGQNRRNIYLTYFCPNGSLGTSRCSEGTETIQGILFCRSSADLIGLNRWCGIASGEGTVLVGVQTRGDPLRACDPYSLRVLATYQGELPEPD